MAAKIRVHELAKELGLTNKETLDLSLGLGIGVKTHSSSIEDAQADRVRRKAEREGMVRDVQPPEPAPVKKGGAKKAAAPEAEVAAPPAAEVPAAPAETAAPAVPTEP
ncbi:MAG: infB, partial [Acidimicrobiales bacterium]|nr:infB [Acidimicrobiales bacterium]